MRTEEVLLGTYGGGAGAPREQGRGGGRHQGRKHAEQERPRVVQKRGLEQGKEGDAEERHGLARAAGDVGIAWTRPELERSLGVAT